HRTVDDAGDRHPFLEAGHWTSSRAGAAADLDLAPTVALAADSQHDASGQELRPSQALVGVPGPVVEADDFAAPQAAGEADQQDGAVTDPDQAGVERPGHGDDVRGGDRGLLGRDPAVLVADSGQDLADMRVG